MSKEEPETLFKLPKKLKEISGMEYSSKLLWAIADSGNENELYQLNAKGEITHTLKITDAQNIDWEDLAADPKGNLYIGDFGNNDNKRTDLAIYAISKDSLSKNESRSVAKIRFSYPQQKEFPPKKTELWYDVEAFVVYKDHFYLFTKNRSKKFDGTTLLYRVPNRPGTHAATLLGSYKTHADYNNNAITGAAISPDQSKIVLLSHSKIWLFEAFTSDNFFQGKDTELSLKHYSQKEAVTFKDNSTLWIADEKVKKSGGNVYQFSLKNLN
ncbi:hypothetical protein LZZ90_05430 [Flavobacterium sp. SM15]|uniref:hypothetical protein n=1 Tax=Flavobacterium sp. SM15 TaxID=2908005 RepID=UPI001EDBCE1C|nr:hypothetical protein [Flavobacterium sp. SM15]MCG2610942.1 hypothetical protein [Flavobacterium sp. SM15]